MSILAVIPARGGSKAIPYKNIIDLNGYPLIYYILNELLKIKGIISKIVVSTDSSEIKDAVYQYFDDRVEVLDRSGELAGDTVTSEAVLEQVLKEINNDYDYTLFAQCTSPFTEQSDIVNLIDVVKGKDSAAFYIEDYGYFFDDKSTVLKPRVPRQQMIPKCRETGNAWIFKTEGFLEAKSRLFGNVGLCKIEYPKNLEIDDYEDLYFIRYLMKLRQLDSLEGKTIYIDIDGTICRTVGGDYMNSVPSENMIKKFNKLATKNRIIYYTARGSTTGIDWREFTKSQLDSWDVKYDDVLVKKPYYDIWIDDKAINMSI